jgi:transmembrane sensor
MSGKGKERKSAAGGSDKPLSDEAIDRLIHLSSGRATPHDRLAFQRWRQQSPAHEAAASEAEALLRAVSETRQANQMRRPGVRPAHPIGAGRRVRRRVLFAGAAASVAVAVIALPALGPLAALYADHSTMVGQRRQVELADGSVATLNTATALSVDYSDGERRIILHAGEALFEVAKNPNRPFVVVVGDAQARAVGTTFAVRRETTCEHVTVTEGIVEVKVGDRQPIRVEAGQRLGVGMGEGDRVKLRSIDVETATAWRRGKLIFNRQSLEGVVTELQRYRADRIVIASDRLRSLLVTGVFDLDDSGHLLRTIEETTKATVVRLPFLTVIR